MNIMKHLHLFGRPSASPETNTVPERDNRTRDTAGNMANLASLFQKTLYWEQYAPYDEHKASLKDCYVAPEYTLSEGRLSTEGVSLDGLMESFLFGTYCPAPKVENRSRSNIWPQLAQRSTALLRGSHGSGKTSFLCKLAHDIASGRYHTERDFFAVDLAKLDCGERKDPADLMALLAEHLGGVPENSILCLDGLDELLLLLDREDQIDLYIAHLAEDVANLTNCKCVITARSGNIDGQHCANLWAANLKPFSLSSRKALIENYVRVHPAAEKHLTDPGSPDSCFLPEDIYLALALDIPLTDSDSFRKLRIARLEQVWERREPNSWREQSRRIAEAMAIRAMAHQGLGVVGCEIDAAYASCDDTVEQFLWETYGLSFLESNHACAVQFRDSIAVYYLAAGNMAQKADACLRTGSITRESMENWCDLFSRSPLPDRFIPFYRDCIPQPGQNASAPGDMINATLQAYRLVQLIPDSSARIGCYLKNMLGIRAAYHSDASPCDISTSDLLRWLSTARSLGAQTDNVTVSDLTFRSDIQQLRFDWLRISNGRFENLQVSLCRLGREFRQTKFQAIVFRHCDLSSVSFTNCRFKNCTFEHCDLSEAVFKDCQLDNVVFTGCNLEHSDLKSTYFYQCTFAESNLRMVVLRDIDECTIRKCDITSIDLRGMDLRNTELDDLYMAGVYGPKFWKSNSAPTWSFASCCILLRQIKNIYQFLENITDVAVFDDEKPSHTADPLQVSCEYLFCLDRPIPQDDLRQFAGRYWPDGIVVDPDFNSEQ